MTRVQIQCAECGFPFRFVDEDVDFDGSCPQCHGWTEKVEVEVEMPDPEYAWFVVDRFGTPIGGPFGGEGDGYRWIMRTGARSDDYPRDSLAVSFLPITPQYKRSRFSGPAATTGDQAFWTPDRVIMLAHLELAAS